LLLQQAVEIVPEYTDALALLAAVCKRLGHIEEAMRAAVQAIISPPCFGGDPCNSFAGFSRSPRPRKKTWSAIPSGGHVSVWRHSETYLS